MPSPQILALTIDKKPKPSNLISINCLKYAAIILDYNAFLDAIDTFNPFYSILYPKALFLTNNTTADSWTKKVATSSAMGKRLNRIFCSLLINQDLGIDSAHIPGDNNSCADTISRVSPHSLSSLPSLLQEHPFLRSFHRYHPPPELTSMIFSSLTTNSEVVPTPRRLKGHFTLANNTISPGAHACT